MPTYEYKCSACLGEFEILQKISDEPLVQCPRCENKTLKRGFGGGQGLIQIKGKSMPGRSSGSCCPCGKNSGSCSKE